MLGWMCGRSVPPISLSIISALCPCVGAQPRLDSERRERWGTGRGSGRGSPRGVLVRHRTQQQAGCSPASKADHVRAVLHTKELSEQGTQTTLQLIVVTCAYLVELVAVVYFTRATSRRVVGALAGGAAVGCFGMGAIVLGNALGLWRVPISGHHTSWRCSTSGSSSRLRQSTSSPGGWPAGSAGVGWRCSLASWRSSARRGITCSRRRSRRGWFSHRALHPSSQTPRPMSVLWPWDTP